MPLFKVPRATDTDADTDIDAMRLRLIFEERILQQLDLFVDAACAVIGPAAHAVPVNDEMRLGSKKVNKSSP